ncbi:MAG: diguanylate cyclase [Burkholderiaceae bacterium]|nr:diguanylate cyclase [Burkholderiaceae bacterium]
MSIDTEQSNSLKLFMTNAGFERLDSEQYEARLARFERLGVKLFGVANCLISFGHIAARINRSETSMIALEASFCDSLPFPSEIEVVPDTRTDPRFAAHRLVQGAPYIRFYVAHPICDTAGKVVGSLILIDYQAREFDEESRLLLTDIALLVERELVIGLMYQAQQELIKQNRVLKRDAMVDPVLGTWNRTAIIRSLNLELERCTRADKPLSLMFVGIDQMSELRAQFGSVASDMIMLRVVSRIRSCIRPFDALGRFDSDHFLMVLPGASHLVVTAVAERIRLAVLVNPDKIDEQIVETSVSAGISSTDLISSCDAETLLQLVEKAYIAAKNAGRYSVSSAALE